MTFNVVFRIHFLLLLTLLLCSGCTTFVRDIKKADNYNKKITETAVVWQTPQNLKTNITLSSPVISDKAKERSNKHVAELVSLFSSHITHNLSIVLDKNQIKVQQQNSAAATQLIITPTSGRDECTALGCNTSLWIQVQLFDTGENKSVWSGAFKVGAQWPAKNDESVVKHFSDSLILELKKSELL